MTPVENALREMLLKCAVQFEFYQQQHLAKGTKESAEKAAVNAQFAAECRKVIAL